MNFQYKLPLSTHIFLYLIFKYNKKFCLFGKTTEYYFYVSFVPGGISWILAVVACDYNGGMYIVPMFPKSICKAHFPIIFMIYDQPILELCFIIFKTLKLPILKHQHESCAYRHEIKDSYILGVVYTCQGIFLLSKNKRKNFILRIACQPFYHCTLLITL